MPAERRDPWEPIGGVLYYAVWFVAWVYQPFRTEKRPMHYPERNHEEPAPRWAFCVSCGHSTIWEPYRWVIEAGSEIDWECVACGSVA